jgi:hypothetical protein
MTISLFLLLAVYPQVQTNAVVPKFEDYQVQEQYKGKTAPPIITKKEREFRTRLREGARGKANFAGRYVLTVWGCGAQCLMGAAIDAKSGKVYWLPFSLCCWPVEVEHPLDFRLDSSLIIFTGSRSEEGYGVYYYKFDDGQFTLLRAIEKPQTSRLRMDRLAAIAENRMLAGTSKGTCPSSAPAAN